MDPSNGEPPSYLPSITIVMPAFNEEGRLRAAVAKTHRVLTELGCQYEIVIVDDGSGDGTPALADALAEESPMVLAKHHQRNRGLGAAFTTGVQAAAHEYVMMVPGDDETPADSIRRVVASTGQSDIVLAYTVHTEVRSRLRRNASRGYTLILNGLTGLRLRYYNGTCAFRTEVVRQIPLETDSFAYMAMILVRLIRGGHEYVEVPVEIEPPKRRSGAFRWQNIWQVAFDIPRIAWVARRLRAP